MIDHVSVGVQSIERGAAFYGPVLDALGFETLVVRAGTVGYGRRYAEFWINLRPHMTTVTPDCGAHVCLRAASSEAVDSFHRAALAHGGADDGPPGPREHDNPDQIYYAAFIRDPDGNRLEAVCFLKA